MLLELSVAVWNSLAIIDLVKFQMTSVHQSIGICIFKNTIFIIPLFCSFSHVYLRIVKDVMSLEELSVAI